LSILRVPSKDVDDARSLWKSLQRDSAEFCFASLP
jgi:hypothetical protein